MRRRILHFLAIPLANGIIRPAAFSPLRVHRFILAKNQHRHFLLPRRYFVQRSGNSDNQDLRRFNGTVTLLDRGNEYIVVSKPPSVLCHHSNWAGSRTKKNKRSDNPEIPMLQRVRQAVGQRVNVIHRLDRGCSGCLLFAYSDSHVNATAILSDAMAKETTIKTYVAIVRGEGILHGRDFKQESWFKVDRPIKNEKGILNNATTYFRFLAGQDSLTQLKRPRASIVLARPLTGKWHQIRRHLNGLSHPILGDSSHGNSKTNKLWREERGMPAERTCLHLARLQMEPSDACPSGIDVSCPLPGDMMQMLENHLPNVLKEATPILQEEGISLFEADAQDNTRRITLDYEVLLDRRT